MDLVTREAVVLDVHKKAHKRTHQAVSQMEDISLVLDWKPDLFTYEVTGDILIFLHLFCSACSVVCVFGPQQPGKAVTRHHTGAMLAFYKLENVFILRLECNISFCKPKTLQTRKERHVSLNRLCKYDLNNVLWKGHITAFTVNCKSVGSHWQTAGMNRSSQTGPIQWNNLRGDLYFSKTNG